MARPVPSLGLENVKPASKRAYVSNDEVASILQGLQLDRAFFTRRMDTSQVQDLLPPKEGEGSKAALPLTPELAGTNRRVDRMKTKVDKNKAARNSQKKVSDFDLLLGESLMPVLAQAIDSLCRQVNRMQMQGDELDPKVRARFNPLTFLAQQLIRRHPKAAKTPRRQAIYANFRNWSDLERGRREILRRKDVIQDVFDGFVLRNVVQRKDIEHVLDAVDDTMRLGGILSGNLVMRRALGLDQRAPPTPATPEPPSPGGTRRRQPQRGKDDFFKDGGWTFDRFWSRFAHVIAEEDVVPFSAIQAGIQAMHQQALLRSEAEDARRREEEERVEAERTARRQFDEYSALLSEIQADEHLQKILNEGKVLTGDDVRPGDAGFEFEVPPSGEHVSKVGRLLVLLGFESLDKTKEKFRTASSNALPEIAKQLSSDNAGSKETADGERWWDDELAAAWTTLQEIYQAEIADGVVEQEVLSKVLVPPVGFHMLRSKILDEIESREDAGGLGNLERAISIGGEAMRVGGASKKPSVDLLCERLGVTMSRMEWLHRLFESFLEPDPKNPGVPPVCLYPDAPASIKKDHMRALMKELRPTMEEVEFEARFRRIDSDGSNQIEFDEFVMWVREDEVRVAGAGAMEKMTFEELAVVYSQTVDLIKYLHQTFEDAFPLGDRDGYPSEPKSLGKAEVRQLVARLAPEMSDAEFETQFQITTFSKKDTLEFDEFLEILPIEELPAEITSPRA